MAEELSSVDTASEVAVHAAGYHKFSLLVKWVMVIAAMMISFLAIWFATPGGFFGGLFVGLIVFGAGTYALRHGWAHSSEDGSIIYPQAR